MDEREVLSEQTKQLRELYKEQTDDLDELKKHLQDFEACDEFACGKCGEMFDRCITGIRNAIASLCSSDAWIIEQLNVLWKGFENLEVKLGGKKPEENKEKSNYFV